MMRRALLWLAPLLALSLTRPDPAVADDATPAAQPQPKPNPTELLKQAATVQKKTAALRGLRVRRAIPMGVQTQEQILKKVEARLAREYTAAEIAAEAGVLKRLGLIPAALDYKVAVLELLKDQVAGYYDPQERRLHLADWLPLSLQEPALAHEICHGLQDQHFGLKRFIKPVKENSDLQLAQAALVEGDCTGVMVEYVLAPQKKDLADLEDGGGDALKAALAQGGSAKLQAAPRYLRETLLFPYLHGMALIQKVRALHPWSAVSAMFKRPPESTEQVLHPEKYWSRERPMMIKPRALPALAGWERVREDRLGEFQLSLFLAQGVDDATAARAAAGWGGDLLWAFRPAGSADAALPLLVHLSAWDSEADAVEFANAARHVLTRARMTAGAASAARGLWVYRALDKSEWSVQLTGEHVLLLAGAPAATRAALQQEVWEHWRVGGKRVRAR